MKPFFPEAKVEFRCREEDIEAHTEIALFSPEDDDIELRRVTLTNRTRKRRIIEITSYTEVVLAPAAADRIASRLPVTFLWPNGSTRRAPCDSLHAAGRDPLHDQSPWMFHLMVVHGADSGTASYETDRMRFIGRGRTWRQTRRR